MFFFHPSSFASPSPAKLDLNLYRMEFVHPEILWGLGALAIPIVIHLLHFRRFKRVQFSQVSFLKDVQRETKATPANQTLVDSSPASCWHSRPSFLPLRNPNWSLWKGTESLEQEATPYLFFVDNSLSMEGHGRRGTNSCNRPRTKHLWWSISTNQRINFKYSPTHFQAEIRHF